MAPIQVVFGAQGSGWNLLAGMDVYEICLFLTALYHPIQSALNIPRVDGWMVRLCV